MITGREATLEQLRAYGMTTVFCNPGSTELPMFRDFPTGFRYILNLQECVVIGITDGFAHSRRRPALVNALFAGKGPRLLEVVVD